MAAASSLAHGPRVGLIGYGEIARFHARHLTAAGARVVGAVTRRVPDGDVRRYASLEAMLPEVDAITVAVPNHLHAATCLAALAAQKPVFLEKPWCLTSAECDALEQALEAAAVPVHAGFRLRWNPRLRHIRQSLTSPRRIACRYRLGIERLAEGKDWTRREAESGGALFTIGVHALDLARWLAGASGQPLQAVTAEVAHEEAGADFPLVARVRGRLGPVEIEAEADLRGDAPFRLDLDLDVGAGQAAASRAAPPGPAPEEDGAADAEYTPMMAAFVTDVRTGHVDPPGIREILQVHRDLLTARAQLRDESRTPSPGSSGP